MALEPVLKEAKEKLQSIITKHRLGEEPVQIAIGTLSTAQAIGNPSRQDYALLEGREVKSLRLGRASLVDAFVRVGQGEAFLVNAEIHPYEFADLTDYDSRRTRKLLMHKKEIESLEHKTKGANLTLVPLEIYTKGRNFKVLVGVGRGKKQFQKKEVKTSYTYFFLQ